MEEATSESLYLDDHLLHGCFVLVQDIPLSYLFQFVIVLFSMQYGYLEVDLKQE